MDRQKLIEDTIKINAINRDGQVFDRGKYYKPIVKHAWIKKNET